jgi:hypothetical protein
MADDTVAPFGRVCTLCKEWKEASHFPVHKARMHRPSRGLRSVCRPCRRLQLRQQRLDDIEHFRQIERESFKRRFHVNGEKKCVRTRQWTLKYKFGMSFDDLLAMLDRQNWQCAVCPAKITVSSYEKTKADVACVDHNHATGAVRGLLCNACNKGIGSLGDDPDRLENAARYLRSFIK